MAALMWLPSFFLSDLSVHMVVSYSPWKQRSSKNKETHSTAFPLKYVITEALIGLVLSREGSDLEQGADLEVSYGSHISSPLSQCQKSFMHKSKIPSLLPNISYNSFFKVISATDYIWSFDIRAVI